MGDNACENVMISGGNDSNCSESTIEIKIKTIDSQIYTLRVDKSVPVTALREHITAYTDVLPEQQRLIFQGRVLRDDQLLSAYHVEDGHTLHLVVRQPIRQSQDRYADHPVRGDSNISQTVGAPVSGGVQEDSDAASFLPAGRQGLLTPFAFLEEILLSHIQRVNDFWGLASDGRLREQDARWVFGLDDVSGGPRQPPDLSGMRRRFGVNVRGDSNSFQTAGAHVSRGVQEDSDAASHLPPGSGGLRTPATLAQFMPSTSQRPNDLLGLGSGWFSSDQTANPSSATVSAGPRHAVFIPGHLSRIRRRFSANVRGDSNSSQTAGGTHASGGVQEDSDAASRLPPGSGGLLTPPASLPEILLSIRQTLNEQAGLLWQLMGQLEDHVNLTDPVAWRSIEVNAMQLRDLLRNLAVFLLEIARTILPMRMGRLPPRVTPNRGNSSRGRRGPDDPASSSSSKVKED